MGIQSIPVAFSYDLPVFRGSHTHILPEYTVVVTGVVEAAGRGQAGYGELGRVAALHAPGGFEDTLYHQVFEGRG